MYLLFHSVLRVCTKIPFAPVVFLSSYDLLKYVQFYVLYVCFISVLSHLFYQFQCIAHVC